MNVAELVAKLGFEVDTKGLKQFENGLAGVAGVAAAMGATVVAAATAATYALIRTAETADEAADAAKKLGLQTNALIELNHAAVMSDVSTESLAQGLKFLSKNAVDAAKGSGETYEAFRKLGVSVRDGNGSFKSADVLLSDVAEGFQSLPEGIERTNLAIKLFGRGGQDMVLLLGQGKQGIAEMRAEAGRLGLLLSDKTQADVAEFDDAMKRMKATNQGAFNILLDALPELTKIINVLSKGIVKFRPQLQKAVKIFGVLLDYAGRALEAVIDLFSKTDLVSAFVSALAAVGVILGVLAAEFVVLNAAAVAAAVSAGAAWAAAVLPIVLAAAVLFLIFDELFAYFEGRPSFFGDFLKFLDEASSNPFFEVVKSFGAVLFDLFEPKRWARAFIALAGLMDEILLAPIKQVGKLFGVEISPFKAAAKIVEQTVLAPETASIDLEQQEKTKQFLKTQDFLRSQPTFTPNPSSRAVSSSVTTIAPTVNINGSGLSGEELQSRVESALSNSLSSTLPAVK